MRPPDDRTGDDGQVGPMDVAMETMTTPTVPAVPQLVPTKTDTAAQIRNESTTMNRGLMMPTR